MSPKNGRHRRVKPKVDEITRPELQVTKTVEAHKKDNTNR